MGFRSLGVSILPERIYSDAGRRYRGVRRVTARGGWITRTVVASGCWTVPKTVPGPFVTIGIEGNCRGWKAASLSRFEPDGPQWS